MGEAKRRKKLMGEAYGKKRQYIVMGTEHSEIHLFKLSKGWYEQIEKNLGNPPNFTMPLTKFRSGKSLCQEWLEEYLSRYNTEIQQKLATEILRPSYQGIYDTCEEIEIESPNNHEEYEALMSYLISLSTQAMFNYSCYQEYLESEDLNSYQLMTKSIYQMVWEEVLENSEDIDEEETFNMIEAIKSIVQECLKPVKNPQGKPKEITLNNQKETLFYQG